MEYLNHLDKTNSRFPCPCSPRTAPLHQSACEAMGSPSLHAAGLSYLSLLGFVVGESWANDFTGWLGTSSYTGLSAWTTCQLRLLYLFQLRLDVEGQNKKHAAWYCITFFHHRIVNCSKTGGNLEAVTRNRLMRTHFIWKNPPKTWNLERKTSSQNNGWKKSFKHRGPSSLLCLKQRPPLKLNFFGDSCLLRKKSRSLLALPGQTLRVMSCWGSTPSRTFFFILFNSSANWPSRVSDNFFPAGDGVNLDTHPGMGWWNSREIGPVSV